MHLCERVISC